MPSPKAASSAAVKEAKEKPTGLKTIGRSQSMQQAPNVALIKAGTAVIQSKSHAPPAQSSVLPAPSTSASASVKAEKPARPLSTSAMTMPTSAAAAFAKTPLPPTPSYGKTDTYKKLEQLGEGTYATVYKGISHVNGKFVALKEIRLEHDEELAASLLKGLKHGNIVTLHDIIYTKLSLTLVFEYLEQDLKMYMDYCGLIEMSNIKLFLFQLLRGLQFCHSRKILHRDLKPQNLLINTAGELKLADFGLARAKSVPSKTYSHEVVTIWYRPPDVLLGSVEYGSSIDMWGVGCIFTEMTSSRPLFPGATNIDQLNIIWKILGTPTTESWPGIDSYTDYRPAEYHACAPQDLATFVPRMERSGLDLAYSLLQYRPDRRITGGEALKHPFFKELGPHVLTLLPEDSIFPASQLHYKKEPAAPKQSSTTKHQQRRASVRF